MVVTTGAQISVYDPAPRYRQNFGWFFVLKKNNVFYHCAQYEKERTFASKTHAWGNVATKQDVFENTAVFSTLLRFASVASISQTSAHSSLALFINRTKTVGLHCGFPLFKKNRFFFCEFFCALHLRYYRSKKNGKGYGIVFSRTGSAGNRC